MAQNKSKRSPLLTILLIFFSLVFAVSGFMLVKYFVGSAMENAAFEKIQKTVLEAKKQESSQGANKDPQEKRSTYLTNLHKENQDLAAWVQIQGTRVNYPVMFTPDDPEHYLRMAFDGSYAESGSLFIGEGCTVDSDNVVIYGHNMNDGSMFADLLKYEDKAYYNQHKALQFDTLDKETAYEIIAVLKTEVSGDHFAYYAYTDFEDEEAFDSYMDQLLDLSLYETDYKAPYGSQLITLSTCSYHDPDGRLVVVAAQKK